MNQQLIALLEKALVELKEKATSSDKHAENKKLYAQDALAHKEPWLLWEFSYNRSSWYPVNSEIQWHASKQYRRKQTKQLVDWSCYLLKGASTNFGELILVVAGNCATLASNNAISHGSNTNRLRLVQPANDKANWQAYNGEDLNALHDAGFVVEVRRGIVSAEFLSLTYVAEIFKGGFVRDPSVSAYRATAIRDGFTDNPEDAVQLEDSV